MEILKKIDGIKFQYQMRGGTLKSVTIRSKQLKKNSPQTQIEILNKIQ